MAATANPEATEAAVEVLVRGGTAIDAAIAAQMALTVTEPQSSGIGGGLFLLYYDAATRKLVAYDGRETAPEAMGPASFLDERGEPLSFSDARNGGLPVGTPGVVAALQQAHEEHGALPWSSLFTHAIELARDGWNVHRRLANGLKTAEPLTKRARRGGPYVDEEGELRKAGERVTNPELAQTLTVLSEKGAQAFYQGEIAREIVDAVNSAPQPGTLTLEDLASYAPVVRSGRCFSYREHEVCGFPAPAGTLVAITIMKLLERFDLASLDPMSAEYLHLYAQASELAYDDRDTYYADPEAVNVPLDALLAPERIAAGSASIREGARSPEPLTMPPVDVERAGHTVCAIAAANGPGPSELASTTHVSIFDANGNVVSMTSSVESNFGSFTMAGGFILNNQLTDFEFIPCVDGALKANAAGSRKRPRSSMSPMIVFDGSGQPVLAVGSPGGAAIISYTAQTALAVLDQGLDPQDAVELPNLLGRNGVLYLEKNPQVSEAVVQSLRSLGHEIQRIPLTSGVSAVKKLETGFAGGADPRRDGVAKGD